MRRMIIAIALSAVFTGSAVWAQDYSTPSGTTDDSSMTSPQSTEPTEQQPAVAGDENIGTTTTTPEEATRGMLKDEIVGLRPQIGALVYKDALSNGDTTTRMAEGITVDMNAMSVIGSAMGMEDMKNWYLGPSTGLIYSHLGPPGSNFFGSNEGQALGGSNFLFIPINLKAGYTFNDRYRIAAHGGGNLVYRSIANTMFLSDETNIPGSTWRMYPNVGADFEIGLGKNVALTLRPDVTIAPEDDFFTGTVALAIPIG